jgi:Immunity protein 27
MSDHQTAKNRLEGNEGQEFARKNLVQVLVDDVNWKILHRNPTTGEYWKEFFPQSEMQGGGPPVFVKISQEEVEREFDIELK